MASTRRTTFIQRLLLRPAEGPSKSSVAEGACQEGGNSGVTLKVAPDGREVFLPPLDPQSAYQVTFQGVCTYIYRHDVGLFFAKWKLVRLGVDALYHVDHLGNFLVPHDSLKLDGVSFKSKKAVAGAMPEEDRELHRYSIRIAGTGRKISVRFDIPWRRRDMRIEGSLTLTVDPLPEGAPSPLTVQRTARADARATDEMTKGEKVRVAAEKARSEIKAEIESTKAAIEVARETATRKSKIESLLCRSHRETHLLDPGFQEQYARHHLTTILDDWKDKWAREYDAFMQDTNLKQLAEQEAPQVVEWFEARVKIVQLAERMMASSSSSPPKKGGKKKTAEEVRALIIRREGVQVDDNIARAKLKAEKIIEAKAALESLPLEDEERERLETELVQDIFEPEGKEHNAEGRITL